MTKKVLATIKDLIEEFAKHSHEYHNPREDVTRGKGDGGNEKMVAVLEKLENMEQRMTKMDQSIHVIRVGCDNCGRTHLTKDCDLDENGNRKAQVFYSSGDRYDEDWRKPRKKWFPYTEYKKQNDEKFT